jgi:ATP-dependent helicase/nuclease subunit A
MMIYDLRFTIYDCNSISPHEMEPSPQANNFLTPAQQGAVAARGYVLVMASAGTGKTHTLVGRCLDCIGRERAALDEIFVVTFTEAAAAEMKQRLRRALEEKSLENPDDSFFAEQLALFDTAHIGTLHSFCFKLVREHFYELGLDPQPAVLDEGEARLLADEALDEELQAQYAGEDEFAVSVQRLIRFYGGARDEKIRSLVLRLHDYAQTRPDADSWLAGQIGKFSTPAPDEWRAWLLEAIARWRDEWLPILEGTKSQNEKAAELAAILSGLGGAGVAPDLPSAEGVGRDARHNRPEACSTRFSREAAAEILAQIISADADWPRGTKKFRKPLEDLFGEAKFLLSLAAVRNGNDPLAEDWNWVRGHMTALLRLTQNFAARFAARKRDDGVLDFHDLEQFALKLLWNFEPNEPTEIARRWREKLQFVFVDEYQDINAAQDKIIQALSSGTGVAPVSSFSEPLNAESKNGDRRDACPTQGNRFLVGDVKQSIYRFRLADPKIFRDYAKLWRGGNGTTIPLAENFRSRESLLHFVNSVFAVLMREEVGGVNYDAEAGLKFGSPEARAELSIAQNPSPRAELLLRLKKGRGEIPDNGESGLGDLDETEKEARLLAVRLRELKNSGHEIWDDKRKSFRPAEWRDIAVLLRSPAGKAEIYAKQFELAGVPLVVARGGFFDSSEILDLLSLLQLLDNPLQDVPCIAVLRSPLVGLSLDELAEIRLAAKEAHFWTALDRSAERGRPARESGNGADELPALRCREKIERFLERFSRWRKLARQVSLSQCLEEILAETFYADWLRTQPRGEQRRANVQQFLNLAQKFDEFQRQGLFRFLHFIEAQRAAEVEPEVPAVAEENAVRLMSVHQSKGLEFPVVAIADMAKPFNLRDLRGEIILDEEYGLCPRVQPPQTGARYPSLPHWLAQRHQRRELLGEELRLLYVAMTRARDTLILSASISEKKWEVFRTKPDAVTGREIISAKSCADWLGLWFGVQSPKSKVQGETAGELPNLRWRIVADEELTGKSKIRIPKSEIDLPTLDHATAEKLRATLSWEYPHAAATRLAAKSSVTALRREAEELDDEAEQIFQPREFRQAAPAQKRKAEGGKRKLSATEIGAAHHKFLQHLALEEAGDRAVLEAEARRLESEKNLSAEERAVLDLKTLADFWKSETGKKIRGQSKFVKRELPFTAKFSPAELAQILGTGPEAGLEGEFVVVQGVADLVVLLPKEIWLLDFKTDEVRASELAAKAKLYAPQVKLYAAALGKIYARPVANRWLHFLALRRTVEI